MKIQKKYYPELISITQEYNKNEECSEKKKNKIYKMKIEHTRKFNNIHGIL